jgi:hypothetical protein
MRGEENRGWQAGSLDRTAIAQLIAERHSPARALNIQQ